MASVSSFNEILGQFIQELVETFPEEKSFKKYNASFDIMRAANPRKCVDIFMSGIGNDSAKIMAKDETFFDSLEGDLDIKKYWTPDLSDATKDAIWQYLQTLNILGCVLIANHV